MVLNSRFQNVLFNRPAMNTQANLAFYMRFMLIFPAQPAVIFGKPEQPTSSTETKRKNDYNQRFLKYEGNLAGVMFYVSCIAILLIQEILRSIRIVEWPK
ncbi:Hypothetical_protein [Hexamita inflata]|uniref:Hypothetical_protein n=1 Tax=Hexamita inflata TaxID=28002 RepID=A0AA86QA39_9EUKA|nr:Hypothetical protein HINF_LOCUS42994 [Hexamita inflata]